MQAAPAEPPAVKWSFGPAFVDASILEDPKPKTGGWRCAFGFATVAILAGVITLLILRYAIAIPMLDDWEMVRLVVKAHDSSLTVSDIFEQQQEARTVIPKLVFIALSWGRFWDGRVQMLLSVMICCLTALGLYRLVARSGLSVTGSAISFALAVVLVFSLAQHEIWLLASGFPSFVPALCIVWGVCIATGKRAIAFRFFACAVLAVCASFSLSNGLLAWGLTFPLVFFAGPAERPRIRWLFFWLVAATICCALYFCDFHARPDLPAFAPQKSLVEYAQYICAFLGGGLGRSGNDQPLAVSIAIGSVLLAGYAAISVWFFLRSASDRRRVVPWLALGGYSVASACLAALGRIQWGVEQALESRYVAFSIYLGIAVIVLTAIAFAELSKRWVTVWPRHLLFPATTLLVGGFLLLAMLCGLDSIGSFRVRSAAARLGQSAVLFGLALDTSQTIKSMNFPRPHFLREHAEALDRLHLLRTCLVRTRELRELRQADADGTVAAGWCDGLTTSLDGRRTVWGWAAFPGKKRPADAVVLAYANERGDWVAFAHSDAIMSRPDVSRNLGSAEQLWSGWRSEFAREALPTGAEISAWAVDAKDAKLYRLKTTERLFNL